MSTETNECGEDMHGAMPPEGMSISLPMMSPPTGEEQPTVELDKDVTIGDVHTADIEPESVSVYANSINPVSSMGPSNIVAFDVVFSVGHVDENGTTNTYQVVKRIGVDKMQLVHHAKSTTPVSIVEAKKPGNGLTTARVKALAGLR